MKVTCKKCGKLFDYDTYMGICPGCAAYYSMSCSCNNEYEKELLRDDDKHKYFDAETIKKTSVSKGAYKGGYGSSSSKRVSKNGKPAFVKAIILFFVIVNFVLPLIGGVFSAIFGIFDSGSASVEDAFVDFVEENIDSSLIDYDNAYETGYRDVYYEDEEESSYIRVYNITYETELSEYLPDDTEIVSFYYEVYDAWDDMIEPSEDMIMNTELYVKLDDGVFQGPEDAVFISKLMEQAGYDSEYISNVGISNNISGMAGNIYFCVRRDSVQALEIDIIDEEGYIHDNYFDDIW